MTQNKTPRQPVIVDHELRINFAYKCLEDRLITKKTNVKVVMEMLMKMYIDGMLDEIIPKGIIPRRKSDNTTRVQLNKDLKGDFEFRAWKTGGIISDPCFGIRALEVIMQMYIDGKIKIKKDEQD